MKLKLSNPLVRKIVQIAAFGFTNPHLNNFMSGKIYTGKWKNFCSPGMNCYSCPAAGLSCPIGAMQALGSSIDFSLSFYVLGFVLAIGLFLGRFVCAFLCPFGLLQELLYKIPLRKFKLPKWSRWVKYVMLLLFVLILPATSSLPSGAGKPDFCEYVCPVGTVEAGIPLVLSNSTLSSALGALFWWKLFLALAILFACVFTCRFFCKVLCPLGAIYGLLNKISFYHVDVEGKKCSSCGMCGKVCPMDVNPVKNPRSSECILCGRCAWECPEKAIRLTFLNGGKKPSKGQSAE